MDPVTQEQFEVKRMAAEAQATASSKGEVVSKEAFDNTSQQLRCILCRKSFQSTKTLNNHLKSNKHLANEKQKSGVSVLSKLEFPMIKFMWID